MNGRSFLITLLSNLIALIAVSAEVDSFRVSAGRDYRLSWSPQTIVLTENGVSQSFHKSKCTQENFVAFWTMIQHKKEELEKNKTLFVRQKAFSKYDYRIEISDKKILYVARNTDLGLFFKKAPDEFLTFSQTRAQQCK
jgi:hypothetical protein